jgi:hypothetical protein
MKMFVIVSVATVLVSTIACGSSSPNCGDVSCPTGMYCDSVESGKGTCSSCPADCNNGGDSGSYPGDTYPKGNAVCQSGYDYTPQVVQCEEPLVQCEEPLEGGGDMGTCVKWVACPVGCQ